MASNWLGRWCSCSGWQIEQLHCWEWASKVVYIGTYLKRSDFKRDNVHLTNSGYHVFIDQLYSSILNSFLQKIMVEVKNKNREKNRQLHIASQLRKKQLSKHATTTRALWKVSLLTNVPPLRSLIQQMKQSQVIDYIIWEVRLNSLKTRIMWTVT